MKPARLKPWAARGALLLASLVVALGLFEMLLRAAAPGGGFGAAQELPWLRDADRSRLFVLDPEFGFRPRLDTELFDEHGTHRNDYTLEAPPGRERLLFLGDSVTARGHIIDALRELYGEERFEYWNAGVESFNTVQEVAYYRRYNAAIEPDHVILTFHLNDFETTPVAFRDPGGRLVVYAPNQPAREIDAWWFANSYLYRLWLGRVVAPGDPFDSFAGEVEEALLSLRRELAASGVRLSVVVLPLIEDPRRWSPGPRHAHQRILAFLRANGIHHVDLLPTLVRALEAGVEVQEAPGDTFHPSPAAARFFARTLHAAGLLEDPPPRASSR